MNKRVARSAVALAVAGGVLFGGSAAFAGGNGSGARPLGEVERKPKVELPETKIQRKFPDPGEIGKGRGERPDRVVPKDPCIKAILESNPTLAQEVYKTGLSPEIVERIKRLKDKIKLPEICPPEVKDPDPGEDPPPAEPEQPEQEQPEPEQPEEHHEDDPDHYVEVVTPAPVVHYTPNFTG